MKQAKIFNIAIDNLSKAELLQQLDRTGGVVVTPNVDHLMKLQQEKYKNFYKAYQEATYRVCDSQFVLWGSKFLGQPLKELIAGSQFFPYFCEQLAQRDDIKIFLLGGDSPEIAETARAKLNAQAGREMVVGTYSPNLRAFSLEEGFKRCEAECQKSIDLINQSGANVLAVGLGAPKQEEWIVNYKHQLKNIHIFLAIGATINFEAGHTPTPPDWIKERGLEWLYRLSSEPKRLWKRYLVEDPPFFWLLFLQKLNLYKSPPFGG